MADLHLLSLSRIAFSAIVIFIASTLPACFGQDPIIPGPTIADCSPRLAALIPCAPFVQGTAEMPAQSCCDNLNQLYSLQPACICLLLNDTTLSAFPINTTLALELPLLCKLQADASACSGGVPSPPAASSGSEVSLGANHNSSSAAAAAASPMLTPTVPVAPKPSIMGLGFARSDAGRPKTTLAILATLTFAAILISELPLPF